MQRYHVTPYSDGFILVDLTTMKNVGDGKGGVFVAETQDEAMDVVDIMSARIKELVNA